MLTLYFRQQQSLFDFFFLNFISMVHKMYLYKFTDQPKTQSQIFTNTNAGMEYDELLQPNNTKHLCIHTQTHTHVKTTSFENLELCDR